MQETIKPGEANLDSSNLIAKRFHDIQGITPYHVSVIEVLAGVIGVNPVEQSLNLSDYTSISALDQIADTDCCSEGEPCAFGFTYCGFDENLLVLAYSDGTIFVFDAE